VVAIFLPLTALLAILVVVWPAARRRIRGASLFVAAGTLTTIPLRIATLPSVARRSAITLAGAATLLFAAIATWSVVQVGHTGAEAVWGGMLCCK
jgi:hypothetical protein